MQKKFPENILLRSVSGDTNNKEEYSEIVIDKDIVNSMRELPADQIAALLVDGIHELDHIPYCKLLKTLKLGNITVLSTISNNDDKYLLLNVVNAYLMGYTDIEESVIEDIIENLIAIFNKDNVLYSIHNYPNTSDISILIKSVLGEIIDLESINITGSNKAFIERIRTNVINRIAPSEEDRTLINIQMFLFVSAFLDMDKLLQYVYLTYLQ